MLVEELIRHMESAPSWDSRPFLMGYAEDALLAKAGCFGSRHSAHSGLVHLRDACKSVQLVEGDATPECVRVFLRRCSSGHLLKTRMRTVLSRSR